MTLLFGRDGPDARIRDELDLIDTAIALMEEGESYASMTVASISARAEHTHTAFYW